MKTYIATIIATYAYEFSEPCIFRRVTTVDASTKAIAEKRARKYACGKYNEDNVTIQITVEELTVAKKAAIATAYEELRRIYTLISEYDSAAKGYRSL